MLKDNELAKIVDRAVECRSDAVRAAWTIVDLTSSDAHVLECQFACSIRIADSAADRRMFAEVFLSHLDIVTAQTLASHLEPAIRSTLRELCGQSNATDAISGTRKQEWIGQIKRAADAIAFAVGLELLAPFQLDIQSHTLQRQRLEEITRARTEARTAGQIQHLQKASELLKQFQALREAAPDLGVGKLLEQINPADRGATLQTLLLASAKPGEKQTLFAVSGNSLVEIDLGTTPPRSTITPLRNELGPLRSVQRSGENLLIGAQRGIVLLEISGSAQPALYAHPDLNSQLGFNAASIAGGMLWASHSEAGIVGWNLDNTQRPTVIHAETPICSLPTAPNEVSILASGSLRGPAGQRFAGARNLLLLNSETLAYTLGGNVIVRRRNQRDSISTGSGSEIISLFPSERQITAIHQDGTIAIIDRNTLQIAGMRRRIGRFSAAAAMPWLGDIRLLLASEDGPIDCIGFEDALVTEYLSPYRGLKMLVADSDVIAAVTPDRQRVVIWNTHDWQRPAGEVHVTSHTRHRIADIEFAFR